MDTLMQKRKVRHWLEDQPAGSIVGQTVNSCECPLANYLKSQGYPTPMVGSKSYWIDEGVYDLADDDHPGINLPRWAIQFILNLDHNPSIPIRSFITREQALRSLEATKGRRSGTSK